MSRSDSFVRAGFALAGVLMTRTVLAQEIAPEEVVITATPLRENPLQVAQPVDVLGGDELRRQIAASIGETIALQLGVSGTYFGPSASRPVIRGLGGDRVLVLQDGISALDVSSLSQDHAVSIESVLADQIEIIRGPATLLYGSGAVGGIVNVVDGRIAEEQPPRALGGSVELRGDSVLSERTMVGRLDATAGGLVFHADAFRRETDDFDIPGNAQSDELIAEHEAEGEELEIVRGKVENSDSETRGGAFGVSAIGERGMIGVAWSRFETNYGVPAAHEHHEEGEGAEEEEEHEHTDVRIDMQQDRYDLKAQLNDVGPIEKVRLRGTYNDYQHVELEGEEIGTTFNQSSYDLRLALDHAEFAGWRGSFGVQYIDTDFEAVGEEAFVPPSRTATTGLFLFEKRDIGDVTLELGARAENQTIDADTSSGAASHDDNSFNASAGAVWRFMNDHALALNLTRSQRHPQAAELFANGPHLAIGRFEIGNPELETETANTADLTLRRYTDGVRWSLTAFYNDFDDYIFPLATGAEQDELPVFQYLQADAEFYGFEGEVVFPLALDVPGGLELRLASDYVRGKLKDGGNLPQIPPLRYGAELHYELERLHVGLETFMYEGQNKLADNELPTDGYTMLDADVSYRFDLGNGGDLLLFLRGANLLNEDARRHISPLKDTVPLPGRGVTIGVRAAYR